MRNNELPTTGLIWFSTSGKLAQARATTIIFVLLFFFVIKLIYLFILSSGQSITECVITVPGYFNQAERRALKDAAALAGLNVLQLINDYTAIAINYGIFRRKVRFFFLLQLNKKSWSAITNVLENNIQTSYIRLTDLQIFCIHNLSLICRLITERSKITELTWF